MQSESEVKGFANAEEFGFWETGREGIVSSQLGVRNASTDDFWWKECNERV